ncbi:DUF3850 domain-containing protein [Listeria monocytogenes]
MTKLHELKTMSEYFAAVAEERKTFEIRKNDRNFMVGDTLILQEYVNGEYTGREYWEDVVYITDYLQKEGIVVMGTLPNEREYPF